MRLSIDSSSILIVKHTLGGEYSLTGVAEDVERYLLENGCRNLRVVSFPLNHQSEKLHVDRQIVNGHLLRVKQRKVRLRPPLSFLWQLATSRHRKRYDIVIGFNPVATAIAFRSARRRGIRVTWRIDFVPPKARGKLMGAMMTAIERRVLRQTDVHIENSELAMEARVSIHPGHVNVVRHIAPVAAWPEWYIFSPPSQRPRAIVFLGGINERTGSSLLAALVSDPAFAKLRIRFDIIGGGSDLDRIRSSVHADNSNAITIHGPIRDESKITQILARSRLALAPYALIEDSFTEFADPGKLKRYLAAGLPILTTEIPAISRSLIDSGGAEIIRSFEAANVWLTRIGELIDSDEVLDARSLAARETAADFISTTVYKKAWTKIVNRLNQQLAEQ